MMKLFDILWTVFYVCLTVTVVFGFIIGGGHVLSMVVHFTRFEGTLIFAFTCFGIGAFFISVEVLDTLRGVKALSLLSNIAEDDCLCSDCAEEKQNNKRHKNGVAPSGLMKARKAFRNNLCSCGSGKKHKRCCGLGQEVLS
ncbi:MAG: hypothetical protein A2504_09830 [Bdellovibrionales bacterium RIFOXYD12_FULL_39_22]|nr:MAG: hypothetical protein A2385_12855 [Bdellovibrionales bacterium RIFOXYB1_FULL_39_21]OFZ43776.1 MAG: hypothetical protein A2485_04670 [Bdellovibrionales bacterium RIFOXYC12_FULL_39_17]OFZ47676.1 MAG: hypothetical protein A2404_09625 [Bdellovibrionales bacterium RIFOXYC1_FULL_39_130]OFZ76458.1 MAG: hypothetical protein A2560_17735 [Bdellovibrionales bacterium RIFOXYD1_FULL_39_84]OFZ95125.1 MAG: hypothetical protein A2504_09830 [Bdellovibrionales bacterium RIFOXYD12_FULL_39_22]HLE11338.1 SE